MADVDAFEEQIRFLRDKLELPTETWIDIWQEAHDKAFVVAGAMDADLLADLHRAVGDAIEDGASLEDFQAQFDAIAAKHGWLAEESDAYRAWRARVIYETNLRTSYAAGRWKYLQSMKERMPYWIYRHSDDVAHPRPAHLAIDGLVLPADDSFWSSAYPPNGWGCKCFVEGASRQYLDLHGIEVDTAPADWKADTGWGYAPGASVAEQMAEAVDQKAAQLPPELRKSWLESLLSGISEAFSAVVSVARKWLGW